MAIGKGGRKSKQGGRSDKRPKTLSDSMTIDVQMYPTTHYRMYNVCYLQMFSEFQFLLLCCLVIAVRRMVTRSQSRKAAEKGKFFVDTFFI